LTAISVIRAEWVCGSDSRNQTKNLPRIAKGGCAPLDYAKSIVRIRPGRRRYKTQGLETTVQFLMAVSYAFQSNGKR